LPSARPGGAPPPRRPITATLPLRFVLDRKAGTEAAHLRLQHGATLPRPEPSAEAEGTQPLRALELPPRASSTGQGPVTKRKQDSEQSSAQQNEAACLTNKCDAHSACRCGRIAERDERAVGCLRSAEQQHSAKRGPRWRSLSRQTARCGTSGEPGTSRRAPWKRAAAVRQPHT